MTTFTTPYFPTWPKLKSAITADPAIETAIADIVAQMTPEEKIGQMVQPDLRGVTPEEARRYKLGSILNGGGAWPHDDKHASAQDWVDHADALWLAVEEAYADRPFRIPFMWATDAVHGHNNVYGATVFPHNIGLGAARDPALIRRIGEVTAIEIAATGLDWTFAPTVATPRDLRWGRVYEGYSEDPAITYAYAAEMVKGLQGDAVTLKTDKKVISNVKHWVGDGGTQSGVDRGINSYSEDNLRNIHAMGYISGLEAGAQVVMSSFNSWVHEANYDHSPDVEGVAYNHKIHGSRYLLTDVLKEQMGFDGLIVTDWHGHAEVSKCTDGNATYAINAGNDILMVPVREHWQSVYHQALEDLKSGVIPMSRADDAVSRILRVKMRAGLWDKPMPSGRSLSGEQSLLGQQSHRDIAREAVRKSLVLLKNNQQVLPLKADAKVLLTGSAADDLQKQSGGWNLTWQGDENTLDDFPGATTTRMALVAALGEDNVLFDPELTSDLSDVDTAIVVFGEDPYAEMMGDIKAWQTLEFASLKRSYRQDVDKITRLKAAGIKVVSVFFSGRPLYVNDLINHSDAFVAAWLPGSEGMGITDVLVGDTEGLPRFDFTGRLSFSWPNKKRSATVSRIPPHIENYQLPDNEQDPEGEHKPLFPYGYGLSYTDNGSDMSELPLDIDVMTNGDAASEATHLYGIKATIGDYQLKVADEVHWIGSDVSRNNAMSLSNVDSKPFNYQQQQDAVELFFKGGLGAVYVQTGDGNTENFSAYRDGAVEFDINVSVPPTKPVFFTIQKWTENRVNSDVIKVDITHQCQQADPECIQAQRWVTVRVPMSEFTQHDVLLNYLDTPFMLFTEGQLTAVLANIRWTA